MKPDQPCYDVIGIGFGPSNLALAIALDEDRQGGISAHFLEKQERFAWHGGMLLPGSDMQISFLKDLALLRNPSSPFTFLNYLHAKGRLEAFINRRTFFPSRLEFNDYLGWAAEHFAGCVSYGEAVTAIEARPGSGGVTSLTVRSRDLSGRERLRSARNVVLAVGGRPHIPAAFAALSGDPRVFHSSCYLPEVVRLGLADRPATRVAVIGRGQSAAEIALDLLNRFSRIGVDMITRGSTLKPSDDTPFVNEIFDPRYTDVVFAQPPAIRAHLLDEFRNTNYAVVDAELLQTLYDRLYQQRITGAARFALLPLREITEAAPQADGIALTLHDRLAAGAEMRRYDAVVLATGYQRDNGAGLLDGLSHLLPGPVIERDYRLRSTPELQAGIYMQGYSEATHGLSDTLLSVLAVRAKEIAAALLASRDRRQTAA